MGKTKESNCEVDDVQVMQHQHVNQLHLLSRSYNLDTKRKFPELDVRS